MGPPCGCCPSSSHPPIVFPPIVRRLPFLWDFYQCSQQTFITMVHHRTFLCVPHRQLPASIVRGSCEVLAPRCEALLVPFFPLCCLLTSFPLGPDISFLGFPQEEKRTTMGKVLKLREIAAGKRGNGAKSRLATRPNNAHAFGDLGPTRSNFECFRRGLT